MMFKSSYFFLLLIACCKISGAQTDTIHLHSHQRDTFYWITENPVKNRFWGNSFYFAGAYNLSKSSELAFDAGRSYLSNSCSGAGCIYSMISWGAGYSIMWKGAEKNNCVRGFAEYSFFYFPPISWTGRADYIYSIDTKAHYLRPSLGFNLMAFDILYNYSFRLTADGERPKHGITFRLKVFTNRKRWERRTPNRC